MIELTWIIYFIGMFIVLTLLVVSIYVYVLLENKRLVHSLIKEAEKKYPKHVNSDVLPKMWHENKLDKMLEASEGNLLLNCPWEMKIGKKERIESKIGGFKKVLLKEKDSDSLFEIPSADLISCKLLGEAFKISPINNERQKVFPKEITWWRWDVLPQKVGLQNLLLLVTIHVKNETEDEVKDIPVFERPVFIKMNPQYYIGQFFKKHWQWVIGTIIGSGLLWEILKVKIK